MNKKRTDFAKLIKDLVGVGWTQAGIAEEIGCHESNISLLANGQRTDPYTSLGMPLIELHRKEMRKAKRRSA